MEFEGPAEFLRGGLVVQRPGDDTPAHAPAAQIDPMGDELLGPEFDGELGLDPLPLGLGCRLRSRPAPATRPRPWDRRAALRSPPEPVAPPPEPDRSAVRWRSPRPAARRAGPGGCGRGRPSSLAISASLISPAADRRSSRPTDWAASSMSLGGSGGSARARGTPGSNPSRMVPRSRPALPAIFRGPPPRPSAPSGGR